jgi:BCD family chlorophyll transporter-like MFS transporter
MIFALYGLALSASSTPFAALLVDISDEDNRSKLIGVVWSMLMIGIVVGAIISGKLLDTPELCGQAILTYDPTATGKIANIPQLQRVINPVFIMIPATVFGLCLLSTLGIEKKYSRYQYRSSVAAREDQITLSKALQVLTSSRQTGLFFGFLLILTLSLFMQDAVMEAYGGEVFGMCISETTKLNVPFGMGTLIGIGTTGFLLLPRLGKKKTTKFGCIAAAMSLSLVILAGFTTNPGLLKGGLLFFGLASGVLTAGATSLMLDLTLAETAGTFIGAWGLAQAMARGLATVLGGTILYLGKLSFANPVLAYTIVFLLEACGMLMAIWVLSYIDIKQFQDNTKKAIAAIMQDSLDS